MSGVQELDARAVAASVAVVEAVGPGQLELPTPCGDWTLGRLLAHMAGQHHGFAAAARGEDTDLTIWADRPVGDQPAAVYRASAAEVVGAFAEEGVLERAFWLPEVHPRLRFPAPTAIGFHLLDYVLHTWDVAAALGTSAEFDAELLDAALAVAAKVPEGPSRLVPGAAFGPGVPLPAEASPLDRLIASSGRSPAWPKR